MERLIIGLGVLLCTVACSTEPTRACTPGGTQSCVCGASTGSQICNGDGSGFGTCMCSGTDGGMGTDAGMSSDAPPIADPVEGTWCAPVSGQTLANVYSFADGVFANVVVGDNPDSSPVNPGCRIETTVAGTYTISSGVLTLMNDPSTEERTDCLNPADNGAGPGSVSAGTAMIDFSVGSGTLTLGSGASAVTLTSCS